MKYFILLVLTLQLSLFAFAQEGTNIEEYYNTGITGQEREQYKVAIYDLSQQINKDPDNARLIQNRGTVYAGLGLHLDAINDFNRSIKLDSTLASAWFNRGISRARFVYTKASCLDIKTAAELGMAEAVESYKTKCGRYIRELGEITEK